MRQIQAVKNYAKQHRMVISNDSYFYDKVSGKAHPVNRPKFSEMLEQAVARDIS